MKFFKTRIYRSGDFKIIMTTESEHSYTDIVIFYKKHILSTTSTSANYFIKEPSKKKINEIFKEKIDRYAIRCIKNPTEQMQLKAIKRNSGHIKYIQNPSVKVQIVAIKSNVSVIAYIANPTEKVQLAVVRQVGRFILFIKNPSEKVQLAAVKQDATAIENIKKPTKKVLDYLRVQQELTEKMNNSKKKPTKSPALYLETNLKWLKANWEYFGFDYDTKRIGIIWPHTNTIKGLKKQLNANGIKYKSVKVDF